MTQMNSIDTLIHARWILPIAPKGLTLENHSIAIQNGRILDILPTEQAPQCYQAKRVISLPQHAVLPGFVNLHSHAAMNLLRGMGADLPLMNWLTEKIWPAEGKLMSPRFVEEGSYVAALEMLAGGITCTSDHYFFPESAAQGFLKAGIRSAVSGIVIGFPSAWAQNDKRYLDKSCALIEKFRNNAMVHTTVAPHAPYTVNNESLKECARISEHYNSPIHIHVHETRFEIQSSLQEHHCRPLERLDKLGLVNDRLIAVHSVHCNDEDISRLTQAHASVCHCPASNLKLASGFAPIAKYLENNINLGIGTDGAASNDKLNMLEEARLAAMLAKAVAQDTTTAKVHDILEAMTLGGARALHWDHEIGSLEKNKWADMTAIHMESVNCLPTFDVAAQILYACGRRNITHTWVAGQLRYEQKKQRFFTQKIEDETIAHLCAQWRNKILH